MSEVFKTLQEIVAEVQRQQNYPVVEVSDSSELVNDLGFQSLDIAQLIAMLEVKLDVDPFSNGATLGSVITAGDLCQLYDNQ